MKKPVKNAEIPPYFRCPISFELMEDPVIVSSGITYERASIQQWLLNGNKACPVTRQVLDSPELIPNTTLKQLIKAWKSDKDSNLDDEVLCREIESRVAVSELLESRVLQGMSKLSKDHPVWKKVKVEGRVCDDFLEGLISLVLERTSVQDEDQAAALAILHTLFLLDAPKSPAKAFAARFDMERYSKLLTSSSKSVRTNSAKLLEVLLSSWNKQDTESLNSLVQGLVSLLAKNIDDGNHDQAPVKSLQLLFSTSSKTIKLRAIRAGAPKLMIDLLAITSAPISIKQQSLELLKAMSCCAEGREALAADHARAIPAILSCVLKISTQATEHGTFIAWALIVCHHSHAAEDSFVEAGGLSTMVMVLQCDCSLSTKQRAGELLKHFSWLWKDL